MRSLSLTDARRLAVLGQLLGGPRPASILDVVERLGTVQVDPTAIIERAERLTLYSRLGAYSVEDLRVLLEEPPRRLLEYDARLVPVGDLPLHRPVMRRFPRPEYSRGRYIAEWMRDNAAFRAYVLDAVRERGPLRVRDLDDRAEVPWGTGGWNDGKNVGRMVENLHLAGELAVARREGGERWWDLFDRVVPGGDEIELPDEPVAVETMERQLRARGLVRPGWGGALDYRLPARDIGEESLRADGVAAPVTIDGLPGEWLAHAELLDALDHGAWQPRTTVLGPFDPLIHDRERALELFGFRFRLELYVPAAKREYGPYALAVLDGERLIGRLDAAFERRRSSLEVRGAWIEPGVAPDRWATMKVAVDELGAWLGVRAVMQPEGPTGVPVTGRG